MRIDPCLNSSASNEFKKNTLEPQNIECRMLNIEAPVFTSAVRYSLFDILNSKYLCLKCIRISHRMIFIVLFCLFCSFPAHAAGEYRTVEAEFLRITIDAEWCNQTASGYWPIRLDITNLGNDRVIDLYGTGNRYWNMGETGSCDIRQSIRLKRADRVKLTVPVPIFADSESFNFQIRERGRILQNFNYAGTQSNMPQD
jgi:hypothetical protein